MLDPVATASNTLLAYTNTASMVPSAYAIPHCYTTNALEIDAAPTSGPSYSNNSNSNNADPYSHGDATVPEFSFGLNFGNFDTQSDLLGGDYSTDRFPGTEYATKVSLTSLYPASLYLPKLTPKHPTQYVALPPSSVHGSGNTLPTSPRDATGANSALVRQSVRMDLSEYETTVPHFLRGGQAISAPSLLPNLPRSHPSSWSLALTEYTSLTELVLSPYFQVPCGIQDATDSDIASSGTLGGGSSIYLEFIPGMVPLSQLLETCGRIPESSPFFRHIASELIRAFADIESQCTFSLVPDAITVENIYLAEQGTRVILRGIGWGTPLSTDVDVATTQLLLRSKILFRCFGKILREILVESAATLQMGEALRSVSEADVEGHQFGSKQTRSGGGGGGGGMTKQEEERIKKAQTEASREVVRTRRRKGGSALPYQWGDNPFDPAVEAKRLVLPEALELGVTAVEGELLDVCLPYPVQGDDISALVDKHAVSALSAKSMQRLKEYLSDPARVSKETARKSMQSMQSEPDLYGLADMSPVKSSSTRVNDEDEEDEDDIAVDMSGANPLSGASEIAVDPKPSLVSKKLNFEPNASASTSSARYGVHATNSAPSNVAESTHSVSDLPAYPPDFELWTAPEQLQFLLQNDLIYWLPPLFQLEGYSPGAGFDLPSHILGTGRNEDGDERGASPSLSFIGYGDALAPQTTSAYSGTFFNVQPAPVGPCIRARFRSSHCGQGGLWFFAVLKGSDAHARAMQIQKETAQRLREEGARKEKSKEARDANMEELNKLFPSALSHSSLNHSFMSKFGDGMSVGSGMTSEHEEEMVEDIHVRDALERHSFTTFLPQAADVLITLCLPFQVVAASPSPVLAAILDACDDRPEESATVASLKLLSGIIGKVRDEIEGYATTTKSDGQTQEEAEGVTPSGTANALAPHLRPLTQMQQKALKNHSSVRSDQHFLRICKELSAILRLNTTNAKNNSTGDILDLLLANQKMIARIRAAESGMDAEHQSQAQTVSGMQHVTEFATSVKLREGTSSRSRSSTEADIAAHTTLTEKHFRELQKPPSATAALLQAKKETLLLPRYAPLPTTALQPSSKPIPSIFDAGDNSAASLPHLNDADALAALITALESPTAEDLFMPQDSNLAANNPGAAQGLYRKNAYLFPGPPGVSVADAGGLNSTSAGVTGGVKLGAHVRSSVLWISHLARHPYFRETPATSVADVRETIQEVLARSRQEALARKAEQKRQDRQERGGVFKSGFREGSRVEKLGGRDEGNSDEDEEADLAYFKIHESTGLGIDGCGSGPRDGILASSPPPPKDLADVANSYLQYTAKIRSFLLQHANNLFVDIHQPATSKAIKEYYSSAHKISRDLRGSKDTRRETSVSFRSRTQDGFISPYEPLRPNAYSDYSAYSSAHPLKKTYGLVESPLLASPMSPNSFMPITEQIHTTVATQHGEIQRAVSPRKVRQIAPPQGHPMSRKEPTKTPVIPPIGKRSLSPSKMRHLVGDERHFSQGLMGFSKRS